MAELGRMKLSLSVMLLLQFAGAEPTQPLLHHTVREGDEATLSCGSVIKDQNNCDSTTWSFTLLYKREVDLVKLGQKVSEETASDRLSLTENCSLVIKRVRAEDVGRYVCKQYKSGTEQKPSGEVSLSVVSMTEWRVAIHVTFFCFVTTERCTQSVKLMFDRKTVAEDSTFTLSESSCFASVKFYKTNVVWSWRNYFHCEVTDGVGSKLFPYRPQLSAEKQEETTATAAPADEASAEPPAASDCSALDYVMLSMRVAELVLVTVIIALLFRAQWNVASAENKPVCCGSTVNYVNVGEISASANKRR